MKIQHLAVAALVVAMASLSVAEAQGRGGRGHFRGQRGMCPQVEGPEIGQRAGQRGAFLEQLNLSDAQREQLAELREQHRSDMQEMRQGMKAGRDDIQAMWLEHREAFMALLDVEQKAQLQEHWASRAERRAECPEGRRPGRGGRFGRGPGGRGDGAGLGSALDLTDTQKEKLAALRDQHQGDMQTLRQDWEANREEIQALRQQHREAFLALLDDDQKAQLEERRAERPEGQRPGRGGPGRGMRPAAGDLTDEQRTALQELRTAFREEVQTLRESGDLDREKFQDMREKHRAAVEGILTETQSDTAAKPAASVKSSTWGRIKSIFH